MLWNTVLYSNEKHRNEDQDKVKMYILNIEHNWIPFFIKEKYVCT